jgi:hypothetical protein
VRKGKQKLEKIVYYGWLNYHPVPVSRESPVITVYNRARSEGGVGFGEPLFFNGGAVGSAKIYQQPEGNSMEAQWGAT